MRKLLLPILSLLLVSCQSTDHGTAAESGYYPDLDALVARVVQARDAQQTALAQFQSARSQLSGLVNTAGTGPQENYVATVNEYDASVEAAVAVGSANAAVDEAASAIFKHWQIETDVYSYTDPRLKAASQSRLAQTRQSYEGMIRVLRQPEATMTTVLEALHDNVAYLKNNPGASALAARGVALGAIEDEIAVLMQQINNAITSADAFIASVQQSL